MHPQLVFTPAADESANQPIVETLDTCGLDYRIEQVPGSAARIACGGDTLTGFTQKQLVKFFQTHGAKFEDS